MVETDGIHDVSNETELTAVKQRSLVNRHLNGTNGTIDKKTVNANKDPPKNLVNFFPIFIIFILLLSHWLIYLFFCHKPARFLSLFLLNMCLPYIQCTHSQQTHRGHLMISFGRMYYSSFICIWAHFMDYTKYSPDSAKLPPY